MGRHSFLQGRFPTRISNLRLLICWQILYHLSHQGSRALTWENLRPGAEAEQTRPQNSPPTLGTPGCRQRTAAPSPGPLPGWAPQSPVGVNTPQGGVPVCSRPRGGVPRLFTPPRRGPPPVHAPGKGPPSVHTPGGGVPRLLTPPGRGPCLCTLPGRGLLSAQKDTGPGSQVPEPGWV